MVHFSTMPMLINVCDLIWSAPKTNNSLMMPVCNGDHHETCRWWVFGGELRLVDDRERCRFSIIISICLVNSSSSFVQRHLCKIISQNVYILWHKTPEAPTLVSQKCLSSPLTFGDAFILLHRVNIDKGFLVLNSGRLLKCDCSWRNG